MFCTAERRKLPLDMTASMLTAPTPSLLHERSVPVLSRYSPALAAQMRAFSQSLSAKARRRYAAIAACQLDHGGPSYMARVLGCDRPTLAPGRQARTAPDALQPPRLRRAGGGRQPRDEVIPGWDTAFLHVLQEHPAGAPRHAAVQWTNLTYPEMADRLAADHGMGLRVPGGKRL
jgi:hypothetical protein